MFLQTLHLSTLCCSSLSNLNPNPNPSFVSCSYSSDRHPPFLLRFKTSRRQNLRYLKTLGIIAGDARPPSPETIDRLLSVINLLKSNGLSESHFSRLSFLCPQIFFSSDPDDLASVFDFLAQDLSATLEESSGLIFRCPEILLSNVEFCLRPTFLFLKELGLKKLNSPTSLNAHLLNSRVDRLVGKIQFLEKLGFSEEESTRICARFPAIFGYSEENNLIPKFKYLVKDMNRTRDELSEFPQYFAFSLEGRIVPRHLHLKERGLRIPLQRMLLWSDHRFYAKWK